MQLKTKGTCLWVSWRCHRTTLNEYEGDPSRQGSQITSNSQTPRRFKSRSIFEYDINASYLDPKQLTTSLSFRLIVQF